MALLRITKLCMMMNVGGIQVMAEGQGHRSKVNVSRSKLVISYSSTHPTISIDQCGKWSRFNSIDGNYQSQFWGAINKACHRQVCSLTSSCIFNLLLCHI